MYWFRRNFKTWFLRFDACQDQLFRFKRQIVVGNTRESMGLFGGKKQGASSSEKLRPSNVGAQSVPGSAPGSYVAPSAPAHDLEDPPLVEAWVVPADQQQQSASSSKQYPVAVGAHAVAQPAPGLVVMPPPGAPSGVVSLPQKSPGLDRRVNPRPEDALYGITFTRKPIQMDACPKCFHEKGRTRTRTYPSLLTWILVLVLLLLFWPLAWLPLVWDKMKTTEHMCVKCNSIVGRVEPCSDCCEQRRK